MTFLVQAPNAVYPSSRGAAVRNSAPNPSSHVVHTQPSGLANSDRTGHGGATRRHAHPSTPTSGGTADAASRAGHSISSPATPRRWVLGGVHMRQSRPAVTATSATTPAHMHTGLGRVTSVKGLSQVMYRDMRWGGAYKLLNATGAVGSQGVRASRECQEEGGGGATDSPAARLAWPPPPSQVTRMTCCTSTPRSYTSTSWWPPAPHVRVNTFGSLVCTLRAQAYGSCVHVRCSTTQPTTCGCACHLLLLLLLPSRRRGRAGAGGPVCRVFQGAALGPGAAGARERRAG